MLNKTFEEQYVLAVDNAEKEKHLSTLIPGSPDYFYYNSLHLLNVDPKLASTENKAKFTKLVADWQKDLSNSRELKMIKLRRSLLKFIESSNKPNSTKKLFDQFRDTLGLSFSHYATITNSNEDVPTQHLYPTTLNTSIFDIQTLYTQNTASYYNFSQRFEKTAYSQLSNNFKLSDDQMKILLGCIKYPLFEKIVDEVIDRKLSFHQYEVVSNFTLPQMDKLASKLPTIIDSNFVQNYLAKLIPNRDLNDWQSNPVEFSNYLKESLKYVNTLSNSFNQTKLSVLYHYLKFEISQSNYPETLIDQYIKLPRYSSFAKTSYSTSVAPDHVIRYNTVDINKIFKNVTQTMDEQLVTELLNYKFKKIDDVQPFSDYFDNQYLKNIITEAKLLSQDQNAEKWIGMVGDHNKVSRLRSRVDIEFLPNNPNYYHPDDKVEIKVAIKNVQHLIIKLFEINTYNYYKNESKQIDTDINLDGLVASEEFKYDYSDCPPIAKVSRSYQFPSLTGKRGIFVLEFIGNGKSSRALLRKGELHFIQETNHIGQLIRVLDEDSLKLTKTSVLIDGNTFKSNEHGEIQVPFTNGSAGRKKIILIYENFATLKDFNAENEVYTLSGGIHLENGSLIYGERAPIAVRTKLFLNSKQISNSYIEEPTLTITSTDNSNPPIVTSKEIKPFNITDLEESIYNYKVSENLFQLKVQFQGKVRNLSKGNSLENVSFEKTLSVNTINQSTTISQVYLKKDADGFKLCHYGKGGEPIPNSVFNIEFKHWMFVDRISTNLQTDINGIINLGQLEDITSIRTHRDQLYIFNLDQYRPSYTYPNDIHCKFGEVIHLPFFSELNRSNLALFEISQTRVSKDLFSLIKLDNKNISLSLPCGEFILILQGRYGFKEIKIQVCDGTINDDFIVGASRILSYDSSKVQSLSFNLSSKDKNLLVQLKNYSEATRVHVCSSYFLSNSITDSLDLISNPSSLNEFTKSQTEYFSGRELGDEINYIFNRKNESKNILPGNSLKKPSLLLHPFKVSKTNQSQEKLNAGTDFEAERKYGSATSSSSSLLRKEKAYAGSSGSVGPFYEFLSTPTQLLYNLKPNDKGEITLPIHDFENSGRFLSVYAVDQDFIYSDSIVLSTPEAKFKEIKLARALDPSKHFKEDKLITTTQPGKLFEINNVDSSRFIIYDTLEKVLSLSKTIISDNTTLNEFSFIGNWSTLSFEQKQEKYSKFSCHELNFFIYQKDKEFFDQVILPFITSKMNKTFIDYYLTGNNEKLAEFISNISKFNQLNTLEKILLAKVFPNHAKSIESNLTQFTEFQPILSIQYDEYFKIALNQLDSDIQSVNDYTVYSAKDEEEGGGGDYDEVVNTSSYMNNNNNNNIDYLASDSFSGFSGPPPPITPMASFAPPPPSSMARESRSMASAKPMMKKMSAPGGASSRARNVQQLYQKIEKTEELAETNYYNTLYRSNPKAIPCNEFWRDYINHVVSNPKGLFLSKYIAFTNSSFTESVMALAVLDLPFNNKESYGTVKPKDGKFSITPNTPIIIFHQELVQGEIDPTDGILINQNFFDQDNRYSYENDESVEIYIKDEFLTSKVYGGKVVIANLTSRKKKLDILLQIPKGSIPVGPSPFYTRDFSIELYPYSNKDLEYFFYFPTVGKYSHFPTHVSEKNKIVSSIKPFEFSVVAKPTIVNQLSWQYIAHFGTLQQILDHLEKSNLNRITLKDVYHRFTDKKIWEKVIELLKEKKFYDSTTWSYSIYHYTVLFAKEFINDKARNLIFGKSINSELLYWNPIENGDMHYYEYSPLVNSRTHKLGAERKILNDKFAAQYENFINLLTFKSNPSDSELLSIVNYLLLQDRFNDAILIMKRVGKFTEQKPLIYQNIHSQIATNSNSNNNNNNNNNNTSTVTETVSEPLDKKKQKEEAKRIKEEEKKIKKEEKEKLKEEKEKLKEEKKKQKEEEKKLKKAGKSGETTPSKVEGDTPISPPVDSTNNNNNNQLPSNPSSIGFNLKIEGDTENVIDVTSFTPPKDVTIQYDYLISYLDFFNSNPAQAKYLSKKYQDYPVQRWNSLFRDIKNKIDQIYNIDSEVIDYDKEIDRERIQSKMATNEPSFDVSMENSKQISVSYSNCNDITINYYIMDIELLFSTNPFVQQELGQFLYVVPNKIESHPLSAKAGTLLIDIPQEFHNKNIMIDCQSAQIHHNLTVYSNNLSVHITEKVGQLRVINKATKKPISKAYVKVYSKSKGGKVEFWKDSYTDISGSVDYSTISSGNISDVSKFSILILSEEYGSLIKECKPPGI